MVALAESIVVAVDESMIAYSELYYVTCRIWLRNTIKTTESNMHSVYYFTGLPS